MLIKQKNILAKNVIKKIFKKILISILKITMFINFKNS